MVLDCQSIITLFCHFFSRAVFGEFYTELIENHVLFKTPEEEAKAAQVSREG